MVMVIDGHGDGYADEVDDEYVTWYYSSCIDNIHQLFRISWNMI